MAKCDYLTLTTYKMTYTVHNVCVCLVNNRYSKAHFQERMPTPVDLFKMFQSYDVIFTLYQLIEKYVQQTHAKTHNMYTMVVKEVIAIERSGEAEQFQDHGNK